MPTTSGWLVAVGAVAAFVVGRLLGVVELYVLGTAAAGIVIVAVIWVRRPVPPIELARRVVPLNVTVGSSARVDIAVANLGRRATPMIGLVDPVEGTVGARMTVAPVRPGTRRGTGYRLPTTRRGPLHVGPLQAQVTDPFGLAVRRLPGVEDLTVLVLPAIEPIGRAHVGGGRHEPLTGRAHQAMATAGIDELVTLRPYVMGDDLRRVHWPSSAHADELLVRRDEERWQGHLSVLLDVRAPALDRSSFERAVSTAAGFVHESAERGDRIRLMTTGSLDSGMVDARRARSDLMERLSLVTQDTGPAPTVPAPQGRQSGTVVVLTGDPDSDLAGPLRAAGFAEVVVIGCDGREART